jgi:protein-S-isoprenylcysteine O-methyltransferase Ste14
MTMSSQAPVLAAVPRPYVETHPIGLLWLVLWVLALCIELAGAGRVRAEATKRDSGSQILLRVFVVPAAVVVILSPRIAPGLTVHPPLVPVVVGMVVFATGEAMRLWAKHALGRYFTYTVQTSSDQPVVTTGPYRFVRHPSYTGLLLMGIGAGLAYGNWLGVGVLTAAMLCGIVYRISVEERALLADLGDRYRAFAEHRKRLIPFVW